MRSKQRGRMVFMRFEDFHDRFPDLAERETRTATVFEHPHLPAGTYAFVECFCATRGCDCRRSLILVRSREEGKVVATLNYGWESTAFYKHWASGSDSMARMMKGVSVAPWGTQTKLSHTLAVQFASMVKDEEYAKRIQRHYAMYKQALGASADDAGDHLDDAWDDGDDLPDPETATEEECLAHARQMRACSARPSGSWNARTGKVRTSRMPQRCPCWTR